ncbi:hypothetical protein WMF47_37470 [Sorangium sp. So ce861]
MREVFPSAAQPRERRPYGQPEAPGDLAHLLALADEEQHPALPGMHLPEQFQQGTRLDLPVCR